MGNFYYYNTWAHKTILINGTWYVITEIVPAGTSEYFNRSPAIVNLDPIKITKISCFLFFKSQYLNMFYLGIDPGVGGRGGEESHRKKNDVLIKPF